MKQFDFCLPTENHQSTHFVQINFFKVKHFLTSGTSSLAAADSKFPFKAELALSLIFFFHSIGFTGITRITYMLVISFVIKQRRK